MQRALVGMQEREKILLRNNKNELSAVRKLEVFLDSADNVIEGGPGNISVFFFEGAHRKEDSTVVIHDEVKKRGRPTFRFYTWGLWWCPMPKGLKRCSGPGDLHFFALRCHRRSPSPLVLRTQNQFTRTLGKLLSASNSCRPVMRTARTKFKSPRRKPDVCGTQSRLGIYHPGHTSWRLTVSSRLLLRFRFISIDS